MLLNAFDKQHAETASLHMRATEAQFIMRICTVWLGTLLLSNKLIGYSKMYRWTEKALISMRMIRALPAPDVNALFSFVYSLIQMPYGSDMVTQLNNLQNKYCEILTYI